MATPPVIVAYVPVLHEGYYRLFQKYRGATLYLLGREITADYRPLTKDLRALRPELVKAAIDAWNICSRVLVASPDDLRQLVTAKRRLILPDEDVMHDIAAKNLAGATIAYDQIFLRWDRRRSEAQEHLSSDHPTSTEPRDMSAMTLAATEAGRSSDIWRRVGAVIARSDASLLPAHHNQAMPSDNTPWAVGDPRGNFSQGASLEASLFIHAEASAIADAARHGIMLEGASIYVTTFPCPTCAKLIAAAGLSTCYYGSGYAVLDGQDVLSASGVKLVRVDLELPPNAADVWAPYT